MSKFSSVLYRPTHLLLSSQERQALEEQKWLQEMETDIMAPFLIGQNNTMNLTGAEAKRFYQDSLDKYKETLVNQVTFIHSRFITVRKRVSGTHIQH